MCHYYIISGLRASLHTTQNASRLARTRFATYIPSYIFIFIYISYAVYITSTLPLPSFCCIGRTGMNRHQPRSPHPPNKKKKVGNSSCSVLSNFWRKLFAHLCLEAPRHSVWLRLGMRTKRFQIHINDTCVLTTPNSLALQIGGL